MFEVLTRGYSCQGNEFSFYMLWVCRNGGATVGVSAGLWVRRARSLMGVCSAAATAGDSCSAMGACAAGRSVGLWDVAFYNPCACPLLPSDPQIRS